MCLAVPGKILERDGDAGVVDFQGSRVRVSLVLTPQSAVGEWVLVHAGFAINELAEADALQTWSYLNAMHETPQADVALGGSVGVGGEE